MKGVASKGSGLLRAGDYVVKCYMPANISCIKADEFFGKFITNPEYRVTVKKGQRINSVGTFFTHIWTFVGHTSVKFVCGFYKEKTIFY